MSARFRVVCPNFTRGALLVRGLKSGSFLNLINPKQ